ncbi:hypothetical protein [Piscinibacter sakaiensis]|uniref:hypothetical protein n=1 Tax=Piscinibacter sakaiensis TaxID=1547922 RepID=UPI003AAD95C1
MSDDTSLDKLTPVMMHGEKAMREISHSDNLGDYANAVSRTPHPTVQWLWGAAALLLAAILLTSFYNVTQQAVARSHLHWANAVQQPLACASSSYADERCGSSGNAKIDGLVIGQVARE